ncbi:MAG TPA: hypothetical protein VGM93_07180, partial [Acidimicrobiales bacterium]
MSRIARSALLALGATALVVASMATASAWTSAHVHRAQAAPQPRDTVVVPPGAQGMTPLASPCRLFDTRVKGGKIANTTRSFSVAASGATAQGGAAGCGIPGQADRIVLNLTAISTGSSGYVRGWANPGTEPTSSVVSFSKAVNPANEVTVGVCGPSSCATKPIQFHVIGSANLVGDIVGFYAPPMQVTVAANGDATTPSGRGWVTGVTHDLTGQYTVTWSQDVAYGCTPWVQEFTRGQFGHVEHGEVPVGIGEPGLDQSRVTSVDGSGNPVDAPFL